MAHTSLEFDKLVRDSGLRPLSRQQIGQTGLYLYLAEGEKRPNQDMPEPHWRVVWAAGVDDRLMFGQPIFVPTHVTLPGSYITQPVPPETRRELAERQAQTLIDTATNTGYWDA